jgi:hypothetical protein
MEEDRGKTPSKRKHTGSRVCSQRASFERGHAGTVWLITPRAGLLTAHLDCIAEWDVSGYLGADEERDQYEKSGKSVIFEFA